MKVVPPGFKEASVRAGFFSFTKKGIGATIDAENSSCVENSTGCFALDDEKIGHLSY